MAGSMSISRSFALLTGGGLIAALLLAVSAQAQSPAVSGQTRSAGAAGEAQPTSEGRSSRPRIGLVLGGGGAKGSAHIGVLRVLDELRIPIDCIAGTSMGALVGGTLATGMTPAAIEQRVLDIDWTETVGGQGRRDRLPIDLKLQEAAYSNPLEVGLTSGRLTAPGGLIETQDIEEEIRDLVADARFTDHFDELPIPFRAVATDMVAGEMVVLSEGDLARAMRASMAIPGAFAPVLGDDQVLADGGIMRNLPVDVARELCADVVIAVWLTTPSPEPADVSSALAIVGRTFDVIIRANERDQIATLTDADVGISVAMGDITTADFQRTRDAIELGRAAADAQRNELMRYSVSAEEYAAWREGLGQSESVPQTLAEVRIEGLDRVNPAFLETRLTAAQPGRTVTVGNIEEDAERIYALGDFEQVDYRISGPSNARVLEYLPREKSWGPDIFRLNIGVATDTSADLLGILRLDHTRGWINDRGGEWHNTLQIGGRSIVASGFYQPLDTRQRFFVHPIGYLENDRQDLYLDSDRIARYFVRELYTQLDFGINIGTRAQLRAGLRRGWYEADLDTGLPIFPEVDRTLDTSLHLRGIYDTRDSVGLPTRGSFISVHYSHGDDWLDGEEDYDLLEGVVQHSFNFRGNSLSVLAGGGRTLSGNLPISQDIQLGGVRTFPGLRPGELRGHGYWYAGTSYLWRLFDFDPIFNQSLYAGLRLQAGEMRGRADLVDDGTLYGLSGQISGRTPIGPFLLSLGFVDNGSVALQFTIGRPVAEGSILDEVY